MYWLWCDLAQDHASLLKVHSRVTCGRKRIGVHQYCNNYSACVTKELALLTTPTTDRRAPTTVRKLPWLIHHLGRPPCGMHLINWLDKKEPHVCEICWPTYINKDLEHLPHPEVLNHPHWNQPSLSLGLTMSPPPTS